MRNASRYIAILTVLSATLLGCKLSGLIPGSGGSGGPGGSGTATGGSDPRADIVAASKKFIELKSFSAKTEGMGQTAIKSQVDYVAPDRYHVMYLGGTGAGMEMIMIGNQSFMKTGGKWSKMPGRPSIPTLGLVYRRGIKNADRRKIRGRGHGRRQAGSCLFLQERYPGRQLPVQLKDVDR